MELIKLTNENIEKEHICCAISHQDDLQVTSKKAWLSAQIPNGLVFLKGDVRGKCFIEYIPAEYAWAAIDAPDYMYIDCLWVSGQFKGKGYSNLLMDACIKDAKEKEKKGLVILSSKKKLGFLSDSSCMKHWGFQTADTAAPYFELLYLPFDQNAEKPKFKEHLKHVHIPDTIPDSNPVPIGDDARPVTYPHTDTENSFRGFTIYYTSQCPFTAKYVPLLEKLAVQKQVPIKVVPITSCKQAQNAPSPFTTFSLYYNGRFITHEILSEKKFEKIIDQKQN